jgi:diamine N-acetyltransferase
MTPIGLVKVLKSFMGNRMKECYLKGYTLVLRLIEHGDVKLIPEWRNTPECWVNFFNSVPLTIDGQEAWYKNLQADHSRLVFIIALRGVSDPVGMISVYNIDQRNQSAEIGNMLIANEEKRKGYAKEAVQILSDYCFSILNINRLYLHVLEDNTEALALYKESDFVREGLLREMIFKEGVFKNVIIMSKLRG